MWHAGQAPVDIESLPTRAAVGADLSVLDMEAHGFCKPVEHRSEHYAGHEGDMENLESVEGAALLP